MYLTHKDKDTHAHAGGQAADLFVVTEAQEVTIRLERQWEKGGVCLHWTLISLSVL